MRDPASGPTDPRRRRFRCRVAPWVVALSLLAGCGGYADEFIGDTDMGRIQLVVDPGRTRRVDDVTRFRIVDGERAYVRVLSRTLPPGAEIVFAPFVAQTGAYRRGGSWIFRGEVTVGRHATWADTLAVASDRPHIVYVERVDAPDSPDMHHVRLVTRERGEARIVLRVQSLDESGRPTRDPPVEDSMIIEVQP